MQAVILAGGLGTRLLSVVSDRPKSMVTIKGKPFLEYQIDLLKRSGIKDILLCVGYMANEISDYFGDGQKFGVNIAYSVEDRPLGTGGAIKHALKLLDELFFLLNGDTIVIINFDLLRSFHAENKCDATIVIKPMKAHNKRYGQVQINNDNRVIRFTEKASPAYDKDFINAGYFIFNKRSIDWNRFPKTFSLEHDLLPVLVKERKVYGFISNGYFIDIGVRSDLLKFEREVTKLNVF